MDCRVASNIVLMPGLKVGEQYFILGSDTGTTGRCHSLHAVVTRDGTASATNTSRLESCPVTQNLGEFFFSSLDTILHDSAFVTLYHTTNNILTMPIRTSCAAWTEYNDSEGLFVGKDNFDFYCSYLNSGGRRQWTALKEKRKKKTRKSHQSLSLHLLMTSLKHS